MRKAEFRKANESKRAEAWPELITSLYDFLPLIHFADSRVSFNGSELNKFTSLKMDLSDLARRRRENCTVRSKYLGY